MKKTHKLLLTLLALLPAMAWAQTRSLDDCIHAALTNNMEVKNSQLDDEATAYKIKEVKSQLLPTVKGNLQYTYYMEVPSQFIDAGAFGGQEGTYQKVSLNMPQTASGSIVINQTIFSQTVSTGLQAARAAQTSTTLQLTLTRENLVYNVASTYYNIQVLNDNLARMADNIANLEHSVKINEVLTNNEIVAASTHKRLLVNLENLRNQYQTQQLALDKNTTLLKYLMNVPLHEPLQAEALDLTQLMYEPAAGTVDDRTDIKLQKEQVKLARLDRKSIVAGYFPTLQSETYLGYTGFNDDFSPTQRINGDWIKSNYFTLSLKVPIFDGFYKKNQIRQKDIVIRQHMNRLDMMNVNAEREIIDAVNNYEANRALLLSSKTNLDIAEDLFRTAQTEHENGITSLTDFLNAQNDLSNARNNYSTALINVKLAELGLKKANGEILTLLK